MQMPLRDGWMTRVVHDNQIKCFLYRIVAKVDDEMLKHYCHEDTFLLEVKPSENEDAFDVTLAEIFLSTPEMNGGSPLPSQ